MEDWFWSYQGVANCRYDATQSCRGVSVTTSGLVLNSNESQFLFHQVQHGVPDGYYDYETFHCHEPIQHYGHTSLNLFSDGFVAL